MAKFDNFETIRTVIRTYRKENENTDSLIDRVLEDSHIMSVLANIDTRLNASSISKIISTDEFKSSL